MNRKNRIQKIASATLLVFAVQLVFAAFTTTISGHSNKKSVTSKYSLKNISQFSNRGLSLSTAKYSLQLKATELKVQNTQGGMLTNSNVEFTKGNTTFIYPYKVKVKVPKFKAPSPTSN